MSDLIRSMCCQSCEQEQRENQRQIARLTRAVRQGQQQTYAPPPQAMRPQYPNFIVPVLVTNMPPVIRR